MDGSSPLLDAGGLSYRLNGESIPCRGLAGSCMSGNVHVRLREKGRRTEMALLYLTLVFNGVLLFLFLESMPIGS